MKPEKLKNRAVEIAGEIRTLGKRTLENPVSAVFAALAAGFVLGLLTRLLDRKPARVVEEEDGD